MAKDTVISTIYPRLPIRITIHSHKIGKTLALLDTGFTGHLAIPTSILNGDLGLPDTRVDWELADGKKIDAPLYFGNVEIVGFDSIPAAITILGNEYIIGRGILDRYAITFDHGEKVVVRR